MLLVKRLLWSYFILLTLPNTVYTICNVVIDGKAAYANPRNLDMHYEYQVKSEFRKFLNITINNLVDTHTEHGIQRFEIKNVKRGECVRSSNPNNDQFCTLNFLHKVPDLLNESRDTVENQFIVVKSEGRDVCVLTIITAKDFRKPSFKLRWLYMGPVYKLKLVKVKSFPYPDSKTLLCDDKTVDANETCDGFIIPTAVLTQYTECTVTLSNKFSSHQVTKQVVSIYSTPITASDSNRKRPWIHYHIIISVLASALVIVIFTCSFIFLKRRYGTNVINNIINTEPCDASLSKDMQPECEFNSISKTSFIGKYKPPLPYSCDTDMVSVLSSGSENDLVTDGMSSVRPGNTVSSPQCSTKSSRATNNPNSSSSFPMQATGDKPQALNEIKS